MASIQLKTAQMIKIAESIGAEFSHKESLNPNDIYQIEENTTVYTPQGEYYGLVLYSFFTNPSKQTLEMTTTLLEFDDEPYIRAKKRNAQINANENQYNEYVKSDFKPLMNKYSHYTDFQINVACGFRRCGPEYNYDVEKMEVYDLLNDKFDLIKDTEEAIRLMGDCEMVTKKLYHHDIWEVRSTEGDIVHHKVLNRAIAECFLLYTDHMHNDWPNAAEDLYL
ncbi:hypothetical protein [Providencia sneebia]|uniref:Uncharacterized protein n=1 Tax=Providencia sneebia DSM 19967 TaxID=1141660 RepID=K8W9H7_9GAMM|nr:hypothetical protein [Providencia sneebia]EKT57308.1 hypothetical protein OO7_07965 [Providencia sneebia DSM 19967]